MDDTMSEASSVTPYRKRFDRQTRREALELLRKRTPGSPSKITLGINSNLQTVSSPAEPRAHVHAPSKTLSSSSDEVDDSEAGDFVGMVPQIKRLHHTYHTHAPHPHFNHDDVEKKSNVSGRTSETTVCSSDGGSNGVIGEMDHFGDASQKARQPQHLQEDDNAAVTTTRNSTSATNRPNKQTIASCLPPYLHSSVWHCFGSENLLHDYTTFH